MAKKIRCPACDAVFARPAAGSTARCPECSRKLKAPGGSDEDDALSPLDGAGRSKKGAGRDKPGKRRRREEPRRSVMPLAIGGGVAALVVVGLLVFGAVQLLGPGKPKKPVAGTDPLNMQVEQEFADPPKSLPPIVAAPPAPEGPREAPPPAMWNAKPDPAPPAKEPLPDTVRVPIGLAEPVFASAGGPFVIDMPYVSNSSQPRVGKAYDLRTGKSVGTFGRKTPIDEGLDKWCYSPDGRHVAGFRGGEPGRRVEVWEVDADKPVASFPLTGNLFWIDYRSADELVTICVDERQKQLQTWGALDGKPRKSLTFKYPPGFERIGGGNTGVFSPGRKQLATSLFGDLRLVDLDTCEVIGIPSQFEEGGTGAYVFSPDGATLIGYGAVRVDRESKFWFLAWDMATGRRVGQPVPQRTPPGAAYPIPGPDDGTLVFRTFNQLGPDAVPAHVVDRSGGAAVFELKYAPVRWVGTDRVLAYTPVARELTGVNPNQKREVYVAKFPREEYATKAGAMRGAAADRPAASAGDRAAVKALAPTPTAWAVPADKPPPAKLPTARWEVEHGDVCFAPAAGQVTSVFALSQSKPVLRTALYWSRYDLKTGEPLGDPIELWPWTQREGAAAVPPAELGQLPPALTPDGKRLVLRDPAHPAWGRVDVWDPKAGRILGLLPYGGSAVEWHGWTADGRLLTVGDGKLTAWEVPSGKASFEVAGNYGGRAGLSPGGAWVVVPSVGHLDVIDAATGACLGRLDGGRESARAWRSFAVSPDGRRLAGLAWTEGKPHTLRTWDLDSGKARHTVALPSIGAPPLHWYGDRHVLVGNDFVDLDLGTAVARFDMAGGLAKSVGSSPDGRLWCVGGVLKAGAFAQARVRQEAGVMASGWRRTLVACTVPDPAVVAELSGAAPAKRRVALHLGMEIAVEVSCSDPARNNQVETGVEELLKREGFKAGPGSGWKLVAKAEQHDVRVQFNAGEPYNFVPGVKGTLTLVGPAGPAGGGEVKADIGNTRSKYEKERDRSGTRDFNFQGLRPSRAFADEYWEAWIAKLDAVKWPRTLMQDDGKYAPLPAAIQLEADRPSVTGPGG